MIEGLQAWAQSVPGWLQWAAVFLLAAIPFVESYSGTFIGIAIGLHPALAAVLAIAGNACATLAVIVLAARVRSRIRSSAASTGSAQPTARRRRIRRLFDRFGIPGVALLGHPTQISSAAMVGFGADRRKVVVWELVSIAGWGTLIAVLAGAGIELLLH